MWGGFATGSAVCAGVWQPIQVPVWSGGVGGGLDAWDRRFSRELEKLWDRPRRKDMIRAEKEAEDEEAAAVLQMLGFLT